MSAAQAAATQTEFAAQLGVGKSYVTALKKAGRLVFTSDGLVDVPASRARIKATTGAPERASEEVTGPVFADSADREKHFQAALVELKYRREVKAVLEADDVLGVVADAATTLRTALEGLADVLAPQIAAMDGDQDKIRALLADEHRRVLATLAAGFDELARLADPDGAGHD